jgi:hypothetical protein
MHGMSSHLKIMNEFKLIEEQNSLTVTILNSTLITQKHSPLHRYCKRLGQ